MFYKKDLEEQIKDMMINSVCVTNNLEYNGKQEVNNLPVYYVFTDKVTNSTIYVKNLLEVKDKVKQERAKWNK